MKFKNDEVVFINDYKYAKSYNILRNNILVFDDDFKKELIEKMDKAMDEVDKEEKAKVRKKEN